MSRADTLLREVNTFANPDEIALLAVVYNDITTRISLAEGDMKALSKAYSVNLTFYEDRLKERYGVFFRNMPGHFEIVQSNKSLYKVADDNLGSVGCAVTLLLKERDGTTLPVAYVTAASSKYRSAASDIIAECDPAALLGVSAQLNERFPSLTKPLEQLAALMADGEAAERDMEVVNVLSQIYTYLRSVGGDVVVDYAKRTAKQFTLAQFVDPSADKGGHLTIVPSQVSASDSDSDSAPCGFFRKAERRMVRSMLKEKGYSMQSDDQGQFYVQAARSVFSFIGSTYIQLPALPEWVVPDFPGSPQRGIAPAPSAAPSASHVPDNVTYAAAESIIHDYLKVDMNKYKEVRTCLSVGGLSDEARELYAGLSAAKKRDLLRPIVGRVTFDKAVQLVAEKLGVGPDDITAEVVASKIVLAKSAFTVRRYEGVLYVEK